jgi:hypothetical protein
VPRDSRGGNSSSELRDDTKVHPRACVLDGQVACSWSGADDQPRSCRSQSQPVPASPRVQFSQRGKEINLVQIVQIRFWGKKQSPPKKSKSRHILRENKLHLTICRQ